MADEMFILPVSFNFKKKSDSKLGASKLCDETIKEVHPSTDFVQTVEDNQING